MEVDIITNLKMKTQYWSISLTGCLEDLSSRQIYNIKDNIKDLEVRGLIPATAGESRLTRSAAGAVLGFLVAGPIGTLAGAGIGAGGAKEAESGKYEVSFIILDPIKVVRGRVSEFELRQLQGFVKQASTAPLTVENRAPILPTPPKPKMERLAAKPPTPRQATKAKSAGEKAKRAEELTRHLKKLDFLLREQIITEDEWEERRAAVKGRLS